MSTFACANAHAQPRACPHIDGSLVPTLTDGGNIVASGDGTDSRVGSTFLQRLTLQRPSWPTSHTGVGDSLHLVIASRTRAALIHGSRTPRAIPCACGVTTETCHWTMLLVLCDDMTDLQLRTSKAYTSEHENAVSCRATLICLDAKAYCL